MLFLSWIIICDIFKFISSETALEIEVSIHLKSLEAQTYLPINFHISTLTTQLENLVTNFTNYELDSLEVVVLQEENVKEDVYSVSELLKELGGEIEKCEENMEENFKQIYKTANEDLKGFTLDGITKAQTVISEARNVFMVAQNYTLAAKITTEHCLSFMDNGECLIDALNTIILMENILPKIISTVGYQHESQLVLLEDEVISKMEGVIVRVFDKYVELLDGFLMCILQGGT